MSVFAPRLTNILTILLRSEAPVSVDRLSDLLGVSRRTIFRDLEGIDLILQESGLSLNTVPGKGISLSGDGEDREKLRLRLSANKAVPQSKRDRHTLLALLLMDNDGMQKLFYYARAIGVSEATVSLDMDLLEPKLNAYGLELNRSRGQGVLLSGPEERIRQGMAALILSLEDPQAFIQTYGHPSALAAAGVRRLIREQWEAKLDWMTAGSLHVLEQHLLIMVDRVQKGHTLTEHPEPAAGLSQKLADQICDSIETAFSIQLPSPERTAVGMLIRTCRAKHWNPLDINDDAVYSYVKRLAFQMIDAFDPQLSATLKLNEDLVNGLSVHLWSAIARLKQGVHLHAEMQEQMKNSYPAVFEKSRTAANLLEQELGVTVPDSEVAFVASHFGAALLHLGERSQRNVILKAGIVCVAGIGVSYMMSSQVRQHFKGELEVVVSEWNSPQEWAQFDLLISSIPLNYDRCPVIMVEHILTEANYLAIRRTIQALTAHRTEDVPAAQGDLPERMERVARRLHDISRMLKNFSKVSIHSDCTFDELAKMIGYQFGTQSESGHLIYHDLVERETIATQVIPQLSILLLHARTGGVTCPVVSLISPEAGQFGDPYFQNARGGLLLLAPRDCDREDLKVFGYISSALVEDDVFLGAVQTGNEPVAYRRIEAALTKYLNDDWRGSFNHVI